MRKDASELIEQLSVIVKDVWRHKENPELLSKALNDIAVFNWALAEWRAEYEEHERSMKTELELDRANGILEHVNNGEAVNKAETKVTISLGEKKKEYNKMASNLEKVKTMMNANSSVMDAVRSRLSLIKMELKQ